MAAASPQVYYTAWTNHSKQNDLWEEDSLTCTVASLGPENTACLMSAL